MCKQASRKCCRKNLLSHKTTLRSQLVAHARSNMFKNTIQRLKSGRCSCVHSHEEHHQAGNRIWNVIESQKFMKRNERTPGLTQGQRHTSSLSSASRLTTASKDIITAQALAVDTRQNDRNPVYNVSGTPCFRMIYTKWAPQLSADRPLPTSIIVSQGGFRRQPLKNMVPDRCYLKTNVE
jgi:hypothetical protein